MKLTFLGATGTVSGSKYLLENAGKKILVDCSLFQGLKEQASSQGLKLIMVAGAIFIGCFALATEAFSFDVHELFENRCGGCHQHAGDLAREKLIIVDGVLRGQGSGRDIRTFLPNHFGDPNPIESVALYDLLLWQNQAGGKFKTRCAICHIKARELAQMNLIRDDKILRGRYSGLDMRTFLAVHGRIDTTEVDFFIDLLMRLSPTAKAR